MATLTIPDDITIAELAGIARAMGKSLKASIAPGQSKETPNGSNTRITDGQPARRLADQPRNR